MNLEKIPDILYQDLPNEVDGYVGLDCNGGIISLNRALPDKAARYAAWRRVVAFLATVEFEPEKFGEKLTFHYLLNDEPDFDLFDILCEKRRAWYLKTI